MDENYAHVQPTGKYHHHGLPIGPMDSLWVSSTQHSPQTGWAADGFPIYALYGFSDTSNASSEVIKMTSSYRAKSGDDQPGGQFDGTFVQGYEYIESLGILDECNGRVTLTPDYPNGIYAYFLTESYPVVPRCVKGSVYQ